MQRYYGDLEDNISVKAENGTELIPSTECDTDENGDNHEANDHSGNGDIKPACSAERCAVKIRGLPWSASPEDIINFLSGASIRGGKNGVHIVLNQVGRASGEAFVELESQTDLDLAMKKDKEYMGKRYIEVYEAKILDMEHELRLSASRIPTESDKSVIKLRGLPFTCSKEDIANFFQGLEIAQNGIMVITDSTGRATGEGFVRFTGPDFATKALEKHKQTIGHRYVEVFASNVREMEAASSGFGSGPVPPPLFGPPPPGGRYAGYASRPSPYDRGHNQGSHHHRTGRMKGGSGGYAGDDYYGYHGGYNGYPPPPPDPSNYYDYGGNNRYGGYPPPQSDARYGPQNGGYPDPYAGYAPPPPPPHYGAPPRGGGGYYASGPMPPSPHPMPPPPGGHRVRMRGLPFTATQQDIYSFFHPMTPVDVHFIYLPNGKFSGEVDADWTSHEEAQEAMRFDRKYIEKRYIELFLYSTPDEYAPPPMLPPLAGRSPNPIGGYGY